MSKTFSKMVQKSCEHQAILSYVRIFEGSHWTFRWNGRKTPWSNL